MHTQLSTKTPVIFDFSIWGGGSVYILAPQTDAANKWVDAHLPEHLLTLGDGIAVEPRYIQDISLGILQGGLSIEKDCKKMIIDKDGECALA